MIVITENRFTFSSFSPVVLPRVAKKTSLEEKVVPVDGYKTDISEKEEREKTIVCILCGNVITFPDCIMEVDGNHRHTFRNPGGVVYRIGCFAAARGCRDVSDPTIEFTWFPGYSWCITVCASCMTHMGWHYLDGGKGFYGLILGKLAENI